MHAPRRSLRILTLSTALGVGLLTTGVAHADPMILFGEGPESLAVDDEKGKLTAEGKKTALKELDKIPGEDAWDLRVYIEMPRKAAEGPLYFEFFRKGETQAFWRWEDTYGGEKYYSNSILLEGDNQFNKDASYTVKVIQVGGSGKDITIISGKIKLINTGREPEPDEGGEEEDEISDQDELDSLGGPDEEEEPDAAPAPEPPPVPETPANKKGCSMTGTAAGFNGLLVLGLLGLSTRRRRKDS